MLILLLMMFNGDDVHKNIKPSCFFLCVCRVGDVAHGNNHDLNADIAADDGQW